VSLPELEIRTRRREELVDVEPALVRLLRERGVGEAVVHLWSLHTTCALTVNENADPDVASDMVQKMQALVPHEENFYRHAEGNSDAHVKTSLFGPGLTLLVHEGEIVLGRWQGVFLAESDGPRTRRIAVKIVEDHGRAEP
jgi:secondary thiamine-phosphate synthase enzyme